MKQLAPLKRKALKLVKLPSVESDLLKSDEDIRPQSRAKFYRTVCMVGAEHKVHRHRVISSPVKCGSFLTERLQYYTITINCCLYKGVQTEGL